ncbi:hypothetical protein Tco_1307385 [Tanacetum coccineum]
MAKFLEWSSGQATWSGGQDVGVVPKGLEWWPRVLLGAPRCLLDINVDRIGIVPPSGTPPLLPIPLPTPLPPLLLPSTDRRADRPEVCLPPRKRLCIAQGPKYEVEESSSAPRPTGGFRADYGFVATLDAEIRRDPKRDVSYGITDTWDEMLVGMPEAPVTDDTELGRRMTEFSTMVRHDTDEIYGRLDEAQDCLEEAKLSRKAWGQSMDASDIARSEIQVTELQSQQGLASGPAQPEIPEEAGSSS